MSALSTIAAIAAGESAPALLQDARLSRFGVETFGRAAIVERLRSAPVELRLPQLIVESDTALTLHAGDIAIHADLYAGAVHRLWLLAPPSVTVVQPRSVAVPNDPDATQIGDELLFRPDDHPDLSPAHGEQVKRLLAALTCCLPAHHRARFVVIRAHSQEQRTAILVRALMTGGGAIRRPLDHTMSAIIDATTAAVSCIVDVAELDVAKGREWRPRLLD